MLHCSMEAKIRATTVFRRLVSCYTQQNDTGAHPSCTTHPFSSRNTSVSTICAVICLAVEPAFPPVFRKWNGIHLKGDAFRIGTRIIKCSSASVICALGLRTRNARLKRSTFHSATLPTYRRFTSGFYRKTIRLRCLKKSDMHIRAPKIRRPRPSRRDRLARAPSNRIPKPAPLQRTASPTVSRRAVPQKTHRKTNRFLIIYSVVFAFFFLVLIGLFIRLLTL